MRVTLLHFEKSVTRILRYLRSWSKPTCQASPAVPKKSDHLMRIVEGIQGIKEYHLATSSKPGGSTTGVRECYSKRSNFAPWHSDMAVNPSVKCGFDQICSPNLVANLVIRRLSLEVRYHGGLGQGGFGSVVWLVMQAYAGNCRHFLFVRLATGCICMRFTDLQVLYRYRRYMSI